MGVHGLTTFVEGNRDLLQDVKFRDSRLVIDGCSLFFRLYFTHGLDMQRGGDYDAFAGRLTQFFSALAACNIEPYVVLDGGIDPSEKKLTTLRERLQSKIKDADSLSRGGGGSVLPILTRVVFIQVLNHRRVPLVQCPAEADREIACLARQWNCPVLTNDSDFYIFDLPGGYLPLSSFQWTNLNGKAHQRYIPARCYTTNRLCSLFGGMNKELLPLCAVLTSVAFRLGILLEVLKLKESALTAVPLHLRLAVAVTAFWLREATPRPPQPQLQALVLGLVYGELSCNSQHGAVPQMNWAAERNTLVGLDQQRVRPGERRGLDIGAAHSFSQWQACLWSALCLNQLLLLPLPEPNVSQLYSGTLVHGLLRYLKSGRADESLLFGASLSRNLYFSLLDAVRNCSSKPHPSSSASGGSRRGRGRRGRGRGGRGGRGAGRGTDDINNRFALLMSEEEFDDGW